MMKEVSSGFVILGHRVPCRNCFDWICAKLGNLISGCTDSLNFPGSYVTSGEGL